MKEGFSLTEGIANGRKCVCIHNDDVGKAIACYQFSFSRGIGETLDDPMHKVVKAIPVGGGRFPAIYDPDWLTAEDRKVIFAMLSNG